MAGPRARCANAHECMRASTLTTLESNSPPQAPAPVAPPPLPPHHGCVRRCAHAPIHASGRGDPSHRHHQHKHQHRCRPLPTNTSTTTSAALTSTPTHMPQSLERGTCIHTNNPGISLTATSTSTSTSICPLAHPHAWAAGPQARCADAHPGLKYKFVHEGVCASTAAIVELHSLPSSPPPPPPPPLPRLQQPPPAYPHPPTMLAAASSEVHRRENACVYPRPLP